MDLAFVEEAYDTASDIIKWYRHGTDFNIHMDEDGLIIAGDGYDQVTWMDVRYQDILPTPRHGKPVEINAYWYSALRIMHVLSELLGKDGRDYEKLAEKVKMSFVNQFWMGEKGYLRDVISGTKADAQIRCNQIWAVSAPFVMLSKEQQLKVVDAVYASLYTPIGLRSLDKNDPEFNPTYGGGLFSRDMAYHQGTVWGFPLGGYYLAYLKAHEYSNKSIQEVKEQLLAIEPCLREGCIGQIAEIYDGEYPAESRGCFAQAWSVGEILKVYKRLE
jgi:predicted glycogen debranching enzyme